MTTRKTKLFSGNLTSHVFSVLPVTSESLFKPIQLPRPTLEGSQPIKARSTRNIWKLSVLRNDTETAGTKPSLGAGVTQGRLHHTAQCRQQGQQ